MVYMFGGHYDMVVFVIILIISSSFHETAHAWVAYKCGDDTAKREGRITLNPLKHICLYNSIIMPVLLYILSNGSFIFGGAKPVPIHPYKLRNPDRDMALSAIAGPISNLIIVVASVIFVLLTKPVLDKAGLPVRITMNFIIVNLLLAFFNMIPVPPLDGSRIIRYIFPSLKELFDTLDNFGIIILIVLLNVFPGILHFIIGLMQEIYHIIDELYKAMPY